MILTFAWLQLSVTSTKILSSILSHDISNANSPVITGAVVSTITIVWTQSLEFPQASVAVHVLVITVSQVSPVSTSANVIVTALQLSVAVATP